MTLNMMMKMFKMAFVECVDSDEKYKDIIPMPMPTKTMILVNMTTHRCSDTSWKCLYCFVEFDKTTTVSDGKIITITILILSLI